MSLEDSLEVAYPDLPIALQNLAVSVQGWRLRRRRYGGDFRRLLSRVRAYDDWGAEQIRRRQRRRLARQLEAGLRSPFWAPRLREASLSPAEDVDLVALDRLPTLRKREIQNCTESLVPDAYDPKRLVSQHTSGTTGAGLVFWETRRAEQLTWATWWRYRMRHGLELGTWCGYFGGRTVVPLSQEEPPYWRINWPARNVMFSAFHLSEETAGPYLKEIKDRRLPWLHGYPSTLGLLARYALENRWEPPAELEIVTTGAESLLPRHKNLIQAAFSVPAREHYGLAEGVANISECPHGALHVDEDYALVEFLPIEGREDARRIVGTNLTNPAFPLFRYETGDYVKLSEDGCNCGVPGRVVERIDGRIEDLVVLPGGAHVGRLDHIFKDLTQIREAQIYQPSRRRIILRVVPGEEWSDRDEQQLLDEARKRLGDEVTLEVEYVDRVPRTDAGKLRFVVSDVATDVRS